MAEKELEVKPWCWTQIEGNKWLHGCSGCRQCLVDHKHKG